MFFEINSEIFNSLSNIWSIGADFRHSTRPGGIYKYPTDPQKFSIYEQTGRGEPMRARFVEAEVKREEREEGREKRLGLSRISELFAVHFRTIGFWQKGRKEIPTIIITKSNFAGIRCGEKWGRGMSRPLGGSFFYPVGLMDWLEFSTLVPAQNRNP